MSESINKRLIEVVISTLPPGEQAKVAQAREALRQMIVLDREAVGLAIVVTAYEHMDAKRREILDQFSSVLPPPHAMNFLKRFLFGRRRASRGLLRSESSARRRSEVRREILVKLAPRMGGKL